jgi:hypothetical protein
LRLTQQIQMSESISYNILERVLSRW